MIFGLVTFAKAKLHPPSFILRSVIHRAMSRLIFVSEMGELGGNNLGKLGVRHVDVRCQPTCIVGII